MSERGQTHCPFPAGSVVVVSGIMGAGKSTVAQLLAEKLPKAAHIRGDVFRRMIVSGRAEMVPGADAEALEQLQLRYRLAAQTADGYAEAGFTAIYQDIVLGADLERVAGWIRARPLFVVVLAPRAEVALDRAETRHKPSGYGDWSVEALDGMLRRTPRLGLWLDTSAQTPAETVREICRRADEAAVPRYLLRAMSIGEPRSVDLLPPGATVRVTLRKLIHRNVAYDAVAVTDDGNHVVVRGLWAETEPRDLGFVTFEAGDIFTEHYWRDRWYSIKEVRGRDGLKGWYCDVARPVVIRGPSVVSHDLDLDLWASADGRTILRLDEDEFLASGTPLTDPATASRAFAALDELERLARNRFADVLG